MTDPERPAQTDDTPAGQDRLEIDNMFLCGSSLTRVSLKDSQIRGSDLSGLRLDDVNLSGAAIDNANLSGLTINNVTLQGATITDANLRDLEISQADLRGMRINGVLVTDLFRVWDRAGG